MKFCPQCAAQFSTTDWPRTCTQCHTTHYRNPKPVAVAVVPVVDGDECLVGILGVQRGTSTGQGAGKWALPGGFVDWNEDMIDGAVRELVEETGIVRSKNECCLLDTVASSDGACALVFVLTPPITREQAARAIANPDECDAVGVLTAEQPLAFASHAAIVKRLMDFAAESAP